MASSSPSRRPGRPQLVGRIPVEGLTPPAFLTGLEASRCGGGAPSRDPTGEGSPSPIPLLDRLRRSIRTLHYSSSTERAYAHWTERFAAHYRRSPERMGADEVRGFLSHLAVEGRVSAATQNQAMAALLFLYRRVLGREMTAVEGATRAKAQKRLPTVLSRGEVNAVLEHMNGVPGLVCGLLYGTGMRLTECLSLRVKDVDRGAIAVRDGKGAKDRVTILPERYRQGLQRQLARTQRLHAEDLRRGLGHAPLPFALAEKHAGADRDWGWQYVFPASGFYTDPRTGRRHRHHVHQTVIQKAMAEAVRRAGMAKPATSTPTSTSGRSRSSSATPT